MRQVDLFYDLMRALQDSGVLKDTILIGSWCQFFYKEYFGYTPYIPEVRTLDIDFLIPNPPRIKKDVNVSKILEQLGFEKQIDCVSGLNKFKHNELVVEFLFSEQGRGRSEPYEIKKLHINAVGLRFLNLLQSHTVTMTRDNIEVNVPEPAAFVLHKHIISERRLNILKKEKDKQTAIEIGEYLLKDSVQRKKLLQIFVSMPKKWQKTLLSILLQHHKDMYVFLGNES